MPAPDASLDPLHPLDPIARFRLDGRVALVTGASSGLGERFARVLHAAGADVVIAARRLDRLDALARDLSGSLAVACDVADDAALVSLVEQAEARFGRVDVLVNNAGIGTAIAAEDEPVELFRRVFEVNVTAVFRLSQLVGRGMLERRAGSIVNVASVLGLVASAPNKQANYCASKGAVVQLTRELGAQWARRGVRVNALAPGFFPSEMTAGMIDDPTSMSYIERNTPMGRMGAVDELDGALLFLASDASTFVTGQVLSVDGGWTAR